MTHLMKTVVSQDGGTIECGERDVYKTTIFRYMTYIVSLIDGSALIDDDRGQEIVTLEEVLFLSTTAAIAVFGIRLIVVLDQDGYEQQIYYTRYQFVFFQVDPETPRWDWKHLVSFDSRGVGDGFQPYGCRERRKLIYLWKLEKMDGWQYNLPIILAWRDGDHIGPILEARVRVRQTHELPCDTKSQLMYSAQLVV